MPNQRGFWNWLLRRSSASDVNEAGDTRLSAQRGGLPEYAPQRANAPDQYVPLTALVEQFNAAACLDGVGQSQPPLTVDEVLTAIRSAGRHQLPLLANHRRLMHSIAETQRVPVDTHLKFTTSWVSPNGYRCEVWWIDLVMSIRSESKDPRHSSASSLRIRDHRLRSWHDPTITIPTEIQRLQADHRWFSTQVEETANQ